MTGVPRAARSRALRFDNHATCAEGFSSTCPAETTNGLAPESAAQIHRIGNRYTLSTALVTVHIDVQVRGSPSGWGHQACAQQRSANRTVGLAPGTLCFTHLSMLLSLLTT